MPRALGPRSRLGKGEGRPTDRYGHDAIMRHNAAGSRAAHATREDPWPIGLTVTAQAFKSAITQAKGCYSVPSLSRFPRSDVFAIAHMDFIPRREISTAAPR